MMALTGVSDDFDLDDHGILRDSFASDFRVDDNGILRDDLDLFMHAVGHGTDSGFGGDKQSSTSTLQHLHASFDEELAPIGDESLNISDFEASRDDLESTQGDIRSSKKPRSRHTYLQNTLDLETPGSTLERPLGASKDYTTSVAMKSQYKDKWNAEGGDQNLFSKEYYEQLRQLGVLVDGADFSREESQTELELLESHLSREKITYDEDEDNSDLIGEYLQNEREREKEEENIDEERDWKKQTMGHNSQASSAPTISGQSFPEMPPEDMYTESQQTGDDDEIFLINHQLLRGSSQIQVQKLSATPSGPHSHSNSRSSYVQTPDQSVGRPKNSSIQQSHSPVATGWNLHHDFNRSESEANIVRIIRTDSVTSTASAVLENSRPLSRPSSAGKSAMSKARSQESFFEQDKQQNSKEDKHPKRLLPTPSAIEANVSLQVKGKSKSVGNIANKSAQVKPTHMTISEITQFTMDSSGNGSGAVSLPAEAETLERLEGELTTQLKQESSKRKQATELVQQLQKEYDSLLSKYALAELTIDQMRLGARITLHTNSPTPISIQSTGAISPNEGAKKARVLQIPVVSAQRAVAGPLIARPGEKLANAQVQTADAQPRSDSRAEKHLSGYHSSSSVGSQRAELESEDPASSRKPTEAETMKLTMQSQAASLNDRLDQFQTLLENRELTLEEQEKAFENIRMDHEKLRRIYLQTKDDYNVLRRSGASLPNTDFDTNKELEGWLFRLGMKFDEIHEQVDANLKQQKAHRQPFQANKLVHNQSGKEAKDSSNLEQAVDRPDSVSTAERTEFEERAEQLHEEYRALMDSYRHLKQKGQTAELQKQTDNIVRKLKAICNEMPDMFRLAPELQERWEKLYGSIKQRSLPSVGREQNNMGVTHPRDHSGPSSMPPRTKVCASPLVEDHSFSTYQSGHNGGSKSRLDDSFRRTPSSLSGSRSSLTSPADHNCSASALQSSTTPSPQDRRGRGSSSSLDGAAAGPRDKSSYDPRIHRPRRHQHDFRDLKLGKMADRGSSSSIPDSGISDQESRSRPPDALANLPGPGKMKQMTHQRGDNDVDSGFVGSVVSTEGAQNLSHNWPREGPLRLRERPPPDRSSAAHFGQNGPPSSSSTTSPQRESGANHPSHDARATSTKSASARIGKNSIDHSYDGELDESTISETHDHGARAKDVRLRLSASTRTAASETDVMHQPRDKHDVLSHLQPERSLLESIQDEETLDDTSGDDISTPCNTDSVEDLQRKEFSVQEASAAPNRPSTPRRPPTPFRIEPQEGEAEVKTSPGAAASERDLRQPSDDSTLSPEQHKSKSLGPVQKQQRPESRGEPTMDLHHTRPKLEHSHDRSHDRDSVFSVESSRPGSSSDRRGREMPNRIRGEDRGVGSDVEIRSDVTRGSSVNSARLRAMQDEIEKLKLGVKQAHDKASERPELSQHPPDQQHGGPDYYDPFDDPYGFMRMPRRRANSFSGGRVRDYDEWCWTLPNNRQNDDGDIPLGYAAADAYNRNHRNKAPNTDKYQLHRRSDRRKYDRESSKNPTGGAEVVNRSEPRLPLHSAAPPLIDTVAAPSGTYVHAQPVRPDFSNRQVLYNYYVPSHHNWQQGNYVNQNPNANPYRQHTFPTPASQPTLTETLAGVQPATSQYQTQQQKRPWYTIRRTQRPAMNASGQHLPLKTVYQQPQQAASVYFAGDHSSRPAMPAQSAVIYKTELCPLCGGSGAHIHEEDVEPVYGYSAQDFATQPGYKHRRRTRQRSHSASRSRHYTPKRSASYNRYLVREIGDSTSEDSDSEFHRAHRRSRSLPRTRGRSESSSSSSRRSSSRGRVRRYRLKPDLHDFDRDIDLNESLVLSEDISRLTNRMIGTVRGELKRYKELKRD